MRHAGENIGEIQSAYKSERLGKTVAIAYMDIVVPGRILDSSFGIIKTVSSTSFLTNSIINALDRRL